MGTGYPGAPRGDSHAGRRPVYNGAQEVPIPTDGRPDPQLHRWLADRLDGAPPDEDDLPTPRGPAPDLDAQVTAPGPRVAALSHATPAWLAAADEPDADPETVRARALPDDGSLEDEPDAATVRVSRLPVSFIGESVIDPTTAIDTRPQAAAWREDTVRAMPRVPARHPPREPVLVPLTPPPDLDPEPTAEPVPAASRRLAWGLLALAGLILAGAVGLRLAGFGG